MAGFTDLLDAALDSIVVEDLSLRAGATWRVGWTFLDGAGAAIDFTGAGTTAKCELRPAPNGTPVLFSFANPIVTSGGIDLEANGTVRLTATAALTAPLASDRNVTSVYDVTVARTGVGTVCVARGRFVIRPEVTV